MSNLIGQVLLGQYRVDSFVASGGMGAVYRVWDMKRNVPLAMKILHSDLADDPSMLKRFKREANMLKKLAHPNIVPFYGVFETSGVVFILERFISGPSLKQVLQKRVSRSLSITESLTVLKTLSAALGYAHVNGVVHCDIKPGNIMIDQGGNIFLTDFGIARYSDSTTTTLATVGTAAYMAPEQIRGETVSSATDVYALGVILFETLTGSRPFRGTEAGTENAGSTGNERIRYAHLNLSPPDPRSINPSIPEGLSVVIQKALSKRPEDRYQSTREMLVATCRGVGLDVGEIPDRFSAPDFSMFVDSGSSYESSKPTIQQPPPRKTAPWLWVFGGGGAIIVFVLFFFNGRLTIPDFSPSLTPSVTQAKPTLRPPSLTPRKSPTRIEPTRQPSRTAAPRATSTPRPSATPTIFCQISRHRVYDWVYISYGQGKQPLFSSNRIGSGVLEYASEAEVMQLIDGPVCSNGVNLWMVQTGAGQQGWIVEAEGNQYYLEPIPGWNACQNAPPSHLRKNDKASISYFPNRPNNAREKSGLDSRVVGYLNPGQVVKIINGPDCNDNYVWWRVIMPDNKKGSCKSFSVKVVR